MTSKAETPVPGKRFIIIGLPRSGTTYLMTLLNAHPQIECAGELFNPYAIIGPKKRNENYEDIARRDANPRRFMEEYFQTAEQSKFDRVGFKYMLGHNARVIWDMNQLTDYSLIFVRRFNKLAQIASLIKAAQTQNWAQRRVNSHVKTKIDAIPQRINHKAQEYASMDTLFSNFFKDLPQHKLWLEYRDMFKPGFEQKLCDFLGVPYSPKMRSPLVKQGSNRILDRFENPGPIEHYFRAIGRADWLEDEI